MAELKTQKNKASVSKFLASVEDEERRKDGQALLKIFKEVLSEKPEMWGTSMVGFGSFHYKSERSKQEGDWPLTAFSPRKQNLTIYIMPGAGKYPELLSKLGKYKISGGSCVYVKRLTDVDTAVLKKLIKQSVQDMKKMHKLKQDKK